MKLNKIIAGFVLLMVSFSTLAADEIGSVTTTFRALGASDKIIVEAFDDPNVKGVTCYVSRAKTGGMAGTFGLAEDTSDASIECIRTSKIELPKDVKSLDGKKIFKESTSIYFKTIQVVRFYDQKRNVLTYLIYSDKLIEGSPKNSITVVKVE